MLEGLQEMAGRHKVRVYLVCLMDNHVHLLVETPGANLSIFMGQLLTGYTVFFNRRHKRVGHLTQGRFKAQLVSGDEYLLKLSRYIHLNPVRTKVAKSLPVGERLERLREYTWSTYRSYAGLERPWSWIEYAPVRAMIGEGATSSYSRFVEAGIAHDDDDFQKLYQSARLAVGADDFQREVERRHTQLGRERARREDVSFRRHLDRRTPDDVLAEVSRAFAMNPADLKRRGRGVAHRAAASWYLHTECGLTQRQVARYLNLGTGAAVGYQIRRWKALRDSKTMQILDARLRGTVSVQP